MAVCISEGDGVQTAVHPLVGGITQQNLAASWQPYKGFGHTHNLPSVLHLPCHMMRLHMSFSVCVQGVCAVCPGCH